MTPCSGFRNIVGSKRYLGNGEILCSLPLCVPYSFPSELCEANLRVPQALGIAERRMAVPTPSVRWMRTEVMESICVGGYEPQHPQYKHAIVVNVHRGRADASTLSVSDI